MTSPVEERTTVVSNDANTPARSAGAPVLRVSVFGGATFEYGGRAVALRSRKPRAILACIALSEVREVSRERLAGLFWSEFGEQNARATLRQAVHEIREAMLAVGCDAVVSTRTAVGLRAGSFLVDLDEIFLAVAAREAPEILFREARLTETFLAGFEDLDVSFHGWLTARRQTLHDRVMYGLEEGYRDTALPRRQRRRLAEAALLLDPTHEEACRTVMRGAAEDGEISVALHAYDELYRLLGDDYDMEPSSPTQALVAEIKQGRFDLAPGSQESALSYEAEALQAQVSERRAAPPAQPRGLVPKPALFVDRFAMNGIAPDQAHLVEGFRIELIGCLARFREWYVTGTKDDLAEESERVPVSARYAVATTAYLAGMTISVVMVLHERPSDLVIWGEPFELRLDSWFDTQQRIVRRIAATLNVQISNERLSRHSHMADISLEAYDVWLRGQLVISRYDAGEWNRAATMLARAIDRQPGYSPLYSSLAQMNNVVHFVQPGKFRDQAHIDRTLGLAQRAVALDPRDSRAQLCLGWALAFCRRFSLAELHMEIACELNSSDTWTLMSSAAFHAYNGDTERALRQITASMELTLVPTVTHWQYLTNIRFLHGDDEGTIVAADRAEDGIATILALRAASLCRLGRTEEAKQDVARFYDAVHAAWAGEVAPTEAAIGRWLLHLYPISKTEIWERLRNGVALIGIPVADLSHHG